MNAISTITKAPATETSMSFSLALEAYASAQAAFLATCDALRAVEEAEQAGGKNKPSPADVKASEDANAFACNASCAAFAVLMETPAPDAESALLKLQAYERFAEIGVFHEADTPVYPNEDQINEAQATRRMIRDLVRFVAPPAPPVAPGALTGRFADIAARLERAFAAENAATDDALLGLTDERDKIEHELVGLQPSTLTEAALLLIVGRDWTDVIRGASSEAKRDEAHDWVETLLGSALRFIGDGIPEALWHPYCGFTLPPRERAPSPAPAALAWAKAREAYQAAAAISDAYTPQRDGDDPEGSDAALDAKSAALERWESLPPPSLAALVEVCLASSDLHPGAHWAWQSITDPRTFRDMLDSGDAGEICAARFALHALRLLGAHHPLLSVVPIAGLCPPWKAPDTYSADTRQASWEHHHATVAPYPGRVAELEAYWSAVLSDPEQRELQDIVGRANVRASVKASH